jgi:hypothetical protein
MGIFTNLSLVMLNLIFIGIDLTVFFLVCRILFLRWNIGWLEKLNDIGKGMVDTLVSFTGRLWNKATQKNLSIKGELFVSLMTLLITRTVFSIIAGLLLNLSR